MKKIILTSLFLLTALPAYADGGGYGMGEHMFGVTSWSLFGFGFLFMIIFWVAAIVGIVLFIKWVITQGGIKKEDKSALDILNERYAKGEINKKEFIEKKKDLK